MPLDLTADAVTLTEQLVNIESVSLDEQAIADAVEAGAARARPPRRSPVAATPSSRAPTSAADERVVIAGHLDTVPLNDNLPGPPRRASSCTASAPAT